MKSHGGPTSAVPRDSSIELFRIVTMMVIVAHHYIVNSGVIDQITQQNATSGNALFALLFGWGGKTGINCFVLITGYFMCASQATVRKFVKLLFEVLFYKTVSYVTFWILYDGWSYSIKDAIKSIVPLYTVQNGFTGAFLVLFMMIPFINSAIHGMNKKTHLYTILVFLMVDTFCPLFFRTPQAFNYVGWFVNVYLVGAYIRRYPNRFFLFLKATAAVSACCLALSWGSVLAEAVILKITGVNYCYSLVSDSNAILAFAMAVAAFLFFKNLYFGYCPLINRLAVSTFGVLLIHGANDATRAWLWGDVFKNAKMFHSAWFPLHAFASVILVYCVCTVLDMLRIRFIERPFMAGYDTLTSKFFSVKGN